MRVLTRWTTFVPILSLLALLVSWGWYDLPVLLLVVNAILLAGAVLAAVQHAEVIAHKVGEPFGSLVLAVAVTIIEVGLIMTLVIAGGPGVETLARDTVFAAVMITTNGIVGLTLVIAGLRNFNAEGSGAALATVFTLTVMTLVLPTFTVSTGDGTFSGGQLAFAGVTSLLLWGLFVFTQTVKHRDFYLPVDDNGQAFDEQHATPPTTRTAMLSLALLAASLLGVVGLAKTESPAIEAVVKSAGLPLPIVGVIIALLVLMPESLAAARNARKDRVQVSLNLAYGSAIASIGLTVPVIALSTLWLSTPLVLGLEPLHLVLLALTAVVGVLTVVSGRATRLQGFVHLIILAAFVFLSAVP